MACPIDNARLRPAAAAACCWCTGSVCHGWRLGRATGTLPPVFSYTIIYHGSWYSSSIQHNASDTLLSDFCNDIAILVGAAVNAE